MKVKLLGTTSKKYIEKQVQICAAAGKLSRMAGSVFDAVDSMKDYDKALKFVNRVIGMGHTSTIDHDYLVFALSKVTPIVEQTIIEERFSSFTIKSRREVDFSKVGFYVPDFHNVNGEIIKDNSEIQKKYKKYMRSLFKDYEKLTAEGINKEDARFILPYSYYGEIIMGLDATSLARMIVRLTKSKLASITELRTLGEELLKISLARAPYLQTIIDKEVMLNDELGESLNDLEISHDYTLVKEPILLSHSEDIDKTLITNMLSRVRGLDYHQSCKIYDEKIKNNDRVMKKLMKEIFNDREHEDLKQINFRFQLSIPFAILTHYTRHRRLSLSIPDFVPNVNLAYYVTPPSIEKSSLNDFYNKIFQSNLKIYKEFKDLGIREEDLVYFTLSGNAVNVIINFDGEAFRWICRLRECTKAQWCIREKVLKMHDEIRKVSKYYADNLGPDCVTKLICSEGKESCGRINVILAKMKENNHE